VHGPSVETKPDYENIHGPLGPFMDTLFMKLFRSSLAEHVGVDSDKPQNDYMGLMELTAAMNARYSDRSQVHRIAQDVLISLFPSWMPGSYSVLFSKPFPEVRRIFEQITPPSSPSHTNNYYILVPNTKFSSRMNAWATMVAGTWLMGECEINDVEVDGGKIGEGQGLLVKRCRFLEDQGVLLFASTRAKFQRRISSFRIWVCP